MESELKTRYIQECMRDETVFWIVREKTGLAKVEVWFVIPEEE